MAFTSKPNQGSAPVQDINNPPAELAYGAFWKPIRTDAKGNQIETGLTPIRCWDFLMDQHQYTLVEFTFTNSDTGTPETRKMAFDASDTRIIRMGQLEFV